MTWQCLSPVPVGEPPEQWPLTSQQLAPGFVFGLVTAAQYIRTGVYQNVLLIGRIFSRWVDWEDRALVCYLEMVLGHSDAGN